MRLDNVRRAVEERTIERFLQCGDPHHGFARIYCDACGHDILLAFSCKTRYFCPSCHQKRVLLYGEWVEENVLAPVPHRQYVFTVPRLLPPSSPDAASGWESCAGSRLGFSPMPAPRCCPAASWG